MGSQGPRVVRGINLDALEDEMKLMEILDSTEDFEERKVVRSRLQEVKAVARAKREEMVRRREEDRENTIRQRQQEAAEHKQRTLAMYDQMAKSGPAGGIKKMPSQDQEGEQKIDLVEDAIQQRQREADLRKKRILAAYDAAAKTGPAGAKVVDFESFKRADVSNYEPPKPTGAATGSSTFSMSGGVPKIVKVSATPPGTPVTTSQAMWEDDLDPMERGIRARQREAEERKRRTLAAYAVAARSGDAGPKSVCLEEYRNLAVPEDARQENPFSCTTGFKGGIANVRPQQRAGAR
ncbi:uncharacterized protein LOC135371123 isoform X2 [Ornithodoros turicata]|uniref:uncharacterized protein LOC135371123 isoform X2 n=1 Tax=Ornithodoros turicata TaxID=34597 RepID=UPI00313A45B3